MARSRSLDPQTLLKAAQAGDRGATGRLISLIERGGDPAREVGRIVFAPSAGVRHVIGVTGAPGAGKSTLADRLIELGRATSERVAVLAVDPSSPYSGGALLGDRVRMQRHVLDDGVFIRSMAARGDQGGLAAAVPEAVRVLAASGFSLVVLETVGVGQVEVEVASQADTTVVVVTPGWGDWIQAAKAGLLETADIFVVNKCDLAGADEAKRDLESMLDLGAPSGGRPSKHWRPPVLLASASSGQGAAEVWAAIDAHRTHLDDAGELSERRERRLLAELRAAVTRRLEQQVRALEGGQDYSEVRKALLARRLDPQEAAAMLVGPGVDEG